MKKIMEIMRGLLKQKTAAVKEAETPPSVPEVPPVPEKPFKTQARRRREMMLAKPSCLYIYDTAKGIYHDRECKLAEDIPDEAFAMVEGFPKNRQFCSNCFRKAMIRRGIASQSHRINSYLHAFNGFGATNDDLYKLFILNKAQVVSISKGNQTACIHVKDDRWRIQKQEGKLYLYHNNYKILPGGKRIFYEDYHRQPMDADSTFTDIVRIMCHHKVPVVKEGAK